MRVTSTITGPLVVSKFTLKLAGAVSWGRGAGGFGPFEQEARVSPAKTHRTANDDLINSIFR